MGVYDMLPKGSQLKLWNCEMVTKKVGDSVPDFGLSEYVVLLREGGYVKVVAGKITEIKENSKLNFYPEDFPDVVCFDKWGGRVSSRNELIGQFQGEVGMDDPYYWSK
ncbi:MAG: hypothetical protein WC196_07230 [Bacilli bacterium]